MKLQINHLSIGILFFLVLAGCNKNDENPDNDGDEDSMPDYLIIDTLSTLNTDITEINQVIYCDYFHQSSEYQIDLNNDNIDDIEFSCSVYAHTVYDEWNIGVRTLHEYVALDVNSQPILLAKYFNYYISTSGDSVRFDYYENYNKDKVYPLNLKIDSLIETCPTILSLNDTLDKNCNWKSGSFGLLSDNKTSGYNSTNVHSGKWGNISHKFIGVKFMEKAEPYYGWIELSENGYNISLHKYGLQKGKNTSFQKDSFTDIDGNVYHSITIGNQVWMVENLKVTHYRNGDPIETTIPENANIAESILPYQWVYLNDGSIYMRNASTFGRLYNWYAVNESRNICPAGWHIPSDSEWTTLINFLGGEDVAGGKMKRTGTVFWESPNYGATNESGFTALAGGIRYGSGEFDYIGEDCHFWSTTLDPNNSDGAINLVLNYYRSSAFIIGLAKVHAASVRCIKDK